MKSRAIYPDLYPAEEPSRLQKGLYWPLGALLGLVGMLPMWMSRPTADLIAFTARRVVRYRRRVVRANLAASLPDLNDEERLKIEKEFYRNLADYFFQTVRFSRMGRKAAMRHIRFRETEVLEQLLDAGKDVVLYTSHFGNWEFVTSLPLWMPRHGPERVVYSHVARPLKNRWFDRFFHRMRSRFNLSVPMKSAARAMAGWHNSGQPFIMGFLSDQKPGGHTRWREVDFLGRLTPFISGTEDLARHFGCAVVYMDMHRLGRDRYEATIRLLTPDASLTQPGELTAEYARRLTNTIRRDPSSYLWSHNRWRLKFK